MSPPTESKLFQPLKVGQIQLNHRVVMAPLTRFRTDDGHIIMEMAKEYYTQRCSEPGGLIIAESNLISPEHGGSPNMPGIWNQDQIARWREITDAIHEKGCFIYCQIVALGRVADAKTLEREGGYPVISSSDTPFPEGSGTIPKPLTKEEIKSTIAAFRQATQNALAAGFDGVEAHGANGYLIDQFTQDTCNRRTDEYGGSVENRSRFALEVARAMIDAAGPDRVAFRLSPFSTFQGMKMSSPLPQFSHLVRKLAEFPLAYLHLVESPVINNVDCEKHEGLEPLLEIWRKTSGGAPVLVAGGFAPDTAVGAVDEEYRGFGEVGVVFGRHFIANPDLPFRIRRGVGLNSYERGSFYAVGRREGYLDYPFSEEYLREVKR